MKSKQPFISLKIVNNITKRTTSTSTHKSRQIFYIFKADKFENCMFKLIVKYPDGGINEGHYKTKQDAIYALRVFLE